MPRTIMSGLTEGERVKPFHEIQAADLTASSMQDEIRTNGYVLLRGILPGEAVDSLLDEVTKVLYAAGWLLPEYDPMERMANNSAACGDPDPTFKRVYQQIFNLELFHALPHQPALQKVMK